MNVRPLAVGTPPVMTTLPLALAYLTTMMSPASTERLALVAVPPVWASVV